MAGRQIASRPVRSAVHFRVRDATSLLAGAMAIVLSACASDAGMNATSGTGGGAGGILTGFGVTSGTGGLFGFDAGVAGNSGAGGMARDGAAAGGAPAAGGWCPRSSGLVFSLYIARTITVFLPNRRL